MINNLLYLISSSFFIISIHKLSSPDTARNGNYVGILGMILACIASFLSVNTNLFLILIVLFCGLLCGGFWGYKVKMTSLPQMVAVLNGLGGLASALIVYSKFEFNILNYLCLIIGLITFSGSLIAFLKLQGLLSKNLNFCKFITLCILVFFVFGDFSIYYLICISLLLGISLTLPIGGADMPVVISILNSLSGITLLLVGLVMSDLLLIIVGTLIGVSGCILSFIMAKAMNRSIFRIVWPKNNKIKEIENANKNVKIGSISEATFFLKNSRKVIIVPGFGMAAAQAQNVLHNMAEILREKYKIDVKYAIHPVAGRMPGHMNVLLAEAKVPYEEVYEMKDINSEFATTDVVYVIGANDITNPSAKTDKTSPLFGMPVLDVEKARTIFFVKRSMASGYAGVDNPLFYASNTIMLLGDAKEVTEKIVKDL